MFVTILDTKARNGDCGCWYGAGNGYCRSIAGGVFSKADICMGFGLFGGMGL